MFVKINWDVLCNVGVMVKVMLIQVVVNKWKVVKEDCYVSVGMVYRKGKKKGIFYGDLVLVVVKLEVFMDVFLKFLVEYKILGKLILGVDNLVLVMGKLIFGLDLRLFGVLIVVLQCSFVFGGVVESFDVIVVL